MPVETVKENKSTPYVIAVDGQPLFGLMINVQTGSDAGAFSVEELNQILFGGGNEVVMTAYERKEKDHSEIRARLLKASK